MGRGKAEVARRKITRDERKGKGWKKGGQLNRKGGKKGFKTGIHTRTTLPGRNSVENGSKRQPRVMRVRRG